MHSANKLTLHVSPFACGAICALNSDTVFKQQGLISSSRNVPAKFFPRFHSDSLVIRAEYVVEMIACDSGQVLNAGKSFISNQHTTLRYSNLTVQRQVSKSNSKAKTCGQSNFTVDEEKEISMARGSPASESRGDRPS
jgi:hypothetical protein